MVEFSNEKLISGVQKMAKAVKKSLGPEGEYILISHPSIPGGFKVTKDGISISIACTSEDPIEDKAMKILRQASKSTANIAGDGTTTTIVLAEKLLTSALEKSKGLNKNELIRSLKERAEFVDNELKKMAKKATNSRLKKVAMVSSNNNAKIAKMVADLYKTSDRVIIEKTQEDHMFSTSIDGLKVDRGFSSRFFVTNHKSNEAELDNPLILITDTKIESLEMIESLLKYIIENNRALLIIGEVSHQVLSTLNLNVSNNVIKFAHITSPAMGYRGEQLMGDIAAMTGGIYYSEMAGSGLMNLSIDGLGKAKKVIVSKDKTIIVPKEFNKEYVDSLRNSDDKSEFLNERIDKISGKLNTIHVGAPTDVERNELYDQVEDVVLACRSAIEQGVLPGGGVAFKDLAKKLGDSVADQIIKEAILEPINIISDYDNYLEWADGVGYDSLKSDVVDMWKSGILDPAKVARESFKNALSVATILLNTNTVVYEGVE